MFRVEHYNRSGVPKRLRVGVAKWSNLHYECMSPKHGRKCDPGIELEILDILSKLLGFTFELKVWPTDGCGTSDGNGTWTGLVGWLQTNEIDITGNVCDMNYYRGKEKWLDYSYPVFQVSQTFVTRAPTPLFDFRPAAPFRIDIWLILSILILTFIFIQTISSKLIDNKSLPKSLMNTFNVMFQYGMWFNPPPVTVSFFVWGATVRFMFVLYSTYVKLSLLHPMIVDRPFATYLELADKLSDGSYKLSVYGKNNKIYCPDPKYCTKIADAMETYGYIGFPHKDRYRDKDGLLYNVASNGNAVFVDGDLWVRLGLQEFKERHKLWVTHDEAASQQHYTYFFRKNFELASDINKALALLGSYKDNIIKRYTGLSYLGTRDEKTVRGSIVGSPNIDMTIIDGPLKYFLFASLLSCVFLVLEVVQFKFRMLKLQLIVSIWKKICMFALIICFLVAISATYAIVSRMYVD